MLVSEEQQPVALFSCTYPYVRPGETDKDIYTWYQVPGTWYMFFFVKNIDTALLVTEHPHSDCLMPTSSDLLVRAKLVCGSFQVDWCIDSTA